MHTFAGHVKGSIRFHETVTDNECKIIANALNMQEKNVIISKNPYDAVWPNGKMLLKNINGKDKMNT